MLCAFVFWPGAEGVMRALQTKSGKLVGETAAMLILKCLQRNALVVRVCALCTWIAFMSQVLLQGSQRKNILCAGLVRVTWGRSAFDLGVEARFWFVILCVCVCWLLSQVL